MEFLEWKLGRDMRNIDDYEKVLYSGENDFEVYQALYRKRRVLESLQSISEGGVIVEIGCGLEPIFQYYDKYSQYICIEPAKKFYELALKQKKNRNNIILINDFFENVLSEIPKHVDYIICSSLLHEVENPYQFLSCIKKIADTDTMVHVNVPNAKSLHRLLALCSGITRDIHDISENNIMLQQHSVFDLQTLNDLISRVGAVKIIKQGSYFLKPFTHAQMKKCLDEGILDRNVLDGLYNVIEFIPDVGSEIFIDFKWIDEIKERK